MPPNSFTQNGNEYSPQGVPKKAKAGRILKISAGLLVAVLIVSAVYMYGSQNAQNKYTKAATAAAKKVNPNAVASNVKVADGFALATVNDPTAKSQAKAGNLTIFKVNNDGSMSQIASGSYFSPIDLLGFGIPLATQAKLAGKNLAQVQRGLADACGYSGINAPGFIGFNGSFNPGGWQIDAATLDNLEQALTSAISSKNVDAKNGEKVICVNATHKNSSASTDKQTYISSFTMELQFITDNGTITSHTFTFAVGPNYYRSYMLDGQKIQTR